MTMSKLPNTGEAVIIDIGEGRDIHPRNKQDVAKRLARWALAKRLRRSNVALPEPDVQVDGEAGQQDRPDLRPRRRRPHSRSTSTEPRRLHHRRRATRSSSGPTPSSSANDKIEVWSRQGLRPGRRPLRLGRQPGLQPLQQGRPPAHPVPHRRLAGRDGGRDEVGTCLRYRVKPVGPANAGPLS